IEKIKKAIIYMTLRGLLFMIPCFIIMPQIMGEQGLWLAVPMSEFLTFLTIAVASQSRYKKKKS
ncbi:MAG: MATE family efflux transporter, partial [Bacteroidales bacterium]|nr:MATE family efflux transporter [Bacteroidales bacterium]